MSEQGSHRISSTALTVWSAQRARNLDRMLAEARRDEAALLGYSFPMLDDLSRLLGSMGDDAGCLFVANLARLLEVRHSQLRRKKKAKR